MCSWLIYKFSSAAERRKDDCGGRAPVDGTRPATSFMTAWKTVRETAGVKCRLHDLRHSFCTKLAEAGVPERTMLDMMDHVSAAMLRYYCHIRAKARRKAIAAVEGGFLFGVPQESPKVTDVAGNIQNVN
jgi:integrase